MDRVDQPVEKADNGSDAAGGANQPSAVTISERAYQLIEEMIVTVRLPPGTMVTEPSLMKQTGFGRTPIREALLRLSEDGLIKIVPRRGIVITDVDIRKQMLLLEIRREIERLIVRRAARRSTEADRERFRRMAADTRRAIDTDDYLLFLRIDDEFNRFSAECSRNPFAIKMVRAIHALSRRFWSLHGGSDDFVAAAAVHADVMEAIAVGDEEAAGQASDRVMDYVEAFTRQTLND
jgi:DNA-binding GntR family transcriptional regulator